MMRLDSDVSQTAIARRLRLSQPSVAARIKRLRDAGVLVTHTGLRLHRLGLLVGTATLSSSSPYQLLSKYRSCPCVLGGFTTSGHENVVLVLAGENAGSLQGIVDQHLRKDPCVQSVDFRLLGEDIDELGLSPSLCPERKESTPCGTLCSGCVQYVAGHCSGCPASFDYRGSFWNANSKNSYPSPLVKI